MINAQQYDPSCHAFLLTVGKNLGIKNPGDYLAGHFYSQEGYKLNEAGANLMLRSIGVVK
jgi:hypothetical protein